MPSRLLVGLAVGSGFDGVDAVVLRSSGVGLGLVPRIERAVRVPFPPSAFRPAGSDSPRIANGVRNVADTAIQAIRSVLVQSGSSIRDAFALGFLDPARSSETAIDWGEAADRIAEQTGATVVHGFRGRDRAVGGSGHPITAAAEYLLFRHDAEERIVVHLGSAAAVLFVPAGARVSDVIGFEAGPCNQFLDALLAHGTRGRESTDPGGKKAVQGCCLDALLARWREHPYFTRKPPKAVAADAFGRGFLTAAFEAARQAGAGLPDLLCTATHLIARAVGEAYRKWFPAATAPRRVVLTGGGVRNGFLWQLVSQQFEGMTVVKGDEVGIPAGARNAAAAAVLAALTCDSVPGNLPVLTGAAGGRLIGQIVPGDSRNWARCIAWLAEQNGEYPRVNRAA